MEMEGHINEVIHVSIKLYSMSGEEWNATWVRHSRPNLSFAITEIQTQILPFDNYTTMSKFTHLLSLGFLLSKMGRTLSIMQELVRELNDVTDLAAV